MAKPMVRGSGSDASGGENPTVHSKGQHHGIPRTPGHVGKPGGTTEPTFGHERVGPTSAVHHHENHTQHGYSPDHPAMGGLHHGTRAKHPTHDAGQAAYEGHGYGGKVPGK